MSLSLVRFHQQMLTEKTKWRLQSFKSKKQIMCLKLFFKKENV